MKVKDQWNLQWTGLMIQLVNISKIIQLHHEIVFSIWSNLNYQMILEKNKVLEVL